MRRKDWFFVTAIWTIVTAYNLWKPFHIDDSAHLEIAKWIIHDPLHPMSGILNWSGTPDPIFQTNQPHLYFYLLAAWAYVFGFSEVSVHLFQSMFSLSAIAIFHSIAVKRVPTLATWLTAMLALGPAFIVEQNAMVDIALLAVWLAFFRYLILDIDSSKQTVRFISMAVFASAGVLIKYSSLVLVGVLLVALLGERRRTYLWVLLIPAATVILWSIFNFLDVGSVHILTRPQSGLSPWRVLEHSFRWVITLGGLLPLGAMILGLTVARRYQSLNRLWWPSLLLMGALSLSVMLGAVSDVHADRVLLLVFLVNGLLIVTWVLACTWQALRGSPAGSPAQERMSELYLLLWIAATTAFYVLSAPFIAARHVLLVLPPLLLLFGQAFGSLVSRRALTVGLGVTLVVSAGLCLSDWRFADFYRRAAAEIASELPSGSRIWTTGHWGWQWYAAQQGMLQADVSKNGLLPGDYLVVPEDITHEDLQYWLPMTIALRTSARADPMAVLCTARHARLYSTSRGPWSLSRQCTGGNITVYRVLPSGIPPAVLGLNRTGSDGGSQSWEG